MVRAQLRRPHRSIEGSGSIEGWRKKIKARPPTEKREKGRAQGGEKRKEERRGARARTNDTGVCARKLRPAQCVARRLPSFAPPRQKTNSVLSLIADHHPSVSNVRTLSTAAPRTSARRAAHGSAFPARAYTYKDAQASTKQRGMRARAKRLTGCFKSDATRYQSPLPTHHLTSPSLPALLTSLPVSPYQPLLLVSDQARPYQTT